MPVQAVHEQHPGVPKGAVNHPSYKAGQSKVWVDPQLPQGANNTPGSMQSQPKVWVEPPQTSEKEGERPSVPASSAPNTEGLAIPRTHGIPKPPIPSKPQSIPKTTHDDPKPAHDKPKPANEPKPKETHAAPQPEPEQTDPEPEPTGQSTEQPQSNNGGELEAPPAIPPLPTLPEIKLPTKLSDYPAATQSAIKAYINHEYPNATTEEQVEAILVTLVKAVATYYAGDLKIIGLLVKILDNANAARAIGGIAWKILPASKKHQVYGAMATYYKQVEGFANTIANAEQTVLDKYSVLFNQPQIDEYQLNVAAWRKIVAVCEQYETTIS
ncbi:hypothetical protein GQ53DRAFT_815624 [Thozetella sp. PMI_491]|nr:hypothetical protein GQ53DRAFT_815624 [Thozetella sp. PMI_491]